MTARGDMDQGGRIARARRVALVLSLLAGTATFSVVVHAHYPIHYWLFFRYVSYWLWALLFNAGSWLVGGAVLKALRVRVPRIERWVLSFTLGLYCFFLSMFVGGLLHLYGPIFAIALPLGLGAIGVKARWRHFRRLAPKVVRACRGRVRVRSPLTLVIALFALYGLLLVYIPTLTPGNIAADSYWYHLTLAQHNAAQGGLARSVEGSFVAAYPQLATIIYTWAWIVPQTTFFDRVELAAHLEFSIFLWTLAGVGVLAARVIPRRRVGLLWVAIFLFPGLFLYDSNLSVAADHILAFWGPPIFLGLLRAWQALNVRYCLLLAVAISGAVLTKYQAGALIFVPILAIVARTGWLALGPRRRVTRRMALSGALAAGIATIVLTAPHWAKNAIWYHDPFYPLLHEHLPVRPWTADTQKYFDSIFKDAFWRPKGTPVEKVLETLGALFTFSFRPHDWFGFHGAVPVFGSLFTLTTIALPFLRANRRLWALVGCTYAGVFVWYWVSHQDRYLQALLPWMAACSAALVVLIWRSGWLARAAVSLLIGLQIVWGGDVPFIPTHALINASPFTKVLELASTGYQKNYFDRLRAFSWWHKIAKELPDDAKVLVHGDIAPLGLEAMIVSDMPGWQGGISYGRYRSYADMFRKLESFGVTHIVWLRDWGPLWTSVADDLIFYSFVKYHVQNTWDAENRHVADLPETAPPETPFGPVLFWGDDSTYQTGLYPVDALTVPGYGRHDASEYPRPTVSGGDDPTQLIDRAEFVIVLPGEGRRFRSADFELVMRRGKYELWARNPQSARR